MQLKFTNKSTTLIIGISGELDHHAAGQVKQKMDTELMKTTTKNLIFDFSNLSFMDSSGIGVLMGRYRMVLRLGGKAAIVNAAPHIKRILEMSGILKIMVLYDHLDTALETLQHTS